MARFALWLSLCLSIASIPACTDRTALQQRAEAAPAQRLVGTWDARFHLDRSPILTMDAGAAAREVRGELAFLANRWLDESYPQIETPTDYGTYDIDFTPFGFDPRGGQPPTAIAGSLTQDSVEIILEPGQSRMNVVLRGKLAGDSITGTWQVSSRAGAGGGGRFVMSRRREH